MKPASVSVSGRVSVSQCCVPELMHARVRANKDSLDCCRGVPSERLRRLPRDKLDPQNIGPGAAVGALKIGQ